MKEIDINCDLGESYGIFKIGNDEEIMNYVSSVNIACGFHSGDSLVMNKTVKLAIEKDICIGAHPGYYDIRGFGRKFINVSNEELWADIIYQLGALEGFIKIYGGKLNHVKPHGALYNTAANDYNIALTVSRAVYDFNKNLILYGLYNSNLIKAANFIGLKTANEFFADRRYENNGKLVSRDNKNSIINDENESINQVLDIIINKKTKSINNKEVNITGQTLCIHGDGINALELAKKIYNTLLDNNIKIKSLRK